LSPNPNPDSFDAKELLIPNMFELKYSLLDNIKWGDADNDHMLTCMGIMKVIVDFGGLETAEVFSPPLPLLLRLRVRPILTYVPIKGGYPYTFM